MTPPDIVITADNTSDDSKPLNVDDVNSIITTTELDNNNNYTNRHVYLKPGVISAGIC